MKNFTKITSSIKKGVVVMVLVLVPCGSVHAMGEGLVAGLAWFLPAGVFVRAQQADQKNLQWLQRQKFNPTKHFSSFFPSVSATSDTAGHVAPIETGHSIVNGLQESVSGCSPMRLEERVEHEVFNRQSGPRGQSSIQRQQGHSSAYAECLSHEQSRGAKGAPVIGGKMESASVQTDTRGEQIEALEKSKSENVQLQEQVKTSGATLAEKETELTSLRAANSTLTTQLTAKEGELAAKTTEATNLKTAHTIALQAKEQEKTEAIAAKDTQIARLNGANSTLTKVAWIEGGIIVAAAIGTVLYIYRKPICAWCKSTFSPLFSKKEPQSVLEAAKVHDVVVDAQSSAVAASTLKVAVVSGHKESLREKIKRDPRTTPLVVRLRMSSAKTPKR